MWEIEEMDVTWLLLRGLWYGKNTIDTVYGCRQTLSRIG